jgi:hypothetical protein
VSDIYAYWRATCAGADDEASFAKLSLPTVGAPIDRENPQCGLWKVRLKKGEPPVLMQIWLADETGKPASAWAEGLRLMNVTAGKELPLLELCERWLFASPATKDEAAFWRREGRWPTDPPPLPARTHNLPADPFEALKAEAEDRAEQVAGWLKANTPIVDQVASDTARNMQAALLDINKRATVMFRAEKDPIVAAGRAVDAKYGWRDMLGDWAEKLRHAFEGFMRAEERRLNEERQRAYFAELEAAEAERARIEAERAQKVADDPVAALTEPEAELPAMPPPPEPVKVQSGGGTGRRAGLKDDWDVEIVDYKLAALLVIEDPDVAIVVGKALKRRVRAAKGRIEIPGVKITKVRRAA